MGRLTGIIYGAWDQGTSIHTNTDPVCPISYIYPATSHNNRHL